MANRITWQQVAAPDFSDAIRAQELSANSLSQGFSGLADLAGTVLGRRRDSASQEAMSRALGITDQAQWDRMMAEGGIGALGVVPGQATDELMDFARGYRDKLQDQARAAQIMDLSAQENSRANSLENRMVDKHNFDMTTGQYNFGRQKLGDQLSDAARALGLQAQGGVAGMARNYTSRQGLEQAILNMGLGAQEQAAYLAEVGNLPEELFNVREGFNPAAQDFANYNVANDTFTNRARELNQSISTDPKLRAVNEATQRYEGIQNHSRAMVDNLIGWSQTQGEDTENIVASSAGDLEGTFDKLRKRYPEVPPEVVAQVMESNLRQRTALFGLIGRDTLVLDDKEINNQLSSLNSPETLTQIFETLNTTDRQLQSNASEQAEFERLARDYAIYRENNMGAQANAVLERMQARFGAEAAAGASEAVVNTRADADAPVVSPRSASRPAEGLSEALDPRAVAANQASLESLARGRQWFNETISPLSRGLGAAAGALQMYGGAMGNYVAENVSSVAPEIGSDWFRASDDMIAAGRAGWDENTAPRDTSAAPETVVKNTLKQAGVGSRYSKGFTDALTALMTGRDTDGGSLTPERATFFQNYIKRVRDEAEDPTPIQALINNPEEYLMGQ